MTGRITYPGGDPNQAIPEMQPSNQAAAPSFRGLTVGKIAAIKIEEPRSRNNRDIHLALVFNEMTDNPEVLLLPANLEIRRLKGDLAKVIAEKVKLFPTVIEELAKQSTDTGLDQIAEVGDLDVAEA